MGEPLCEQDAFGRRFRMNFKGQPLILNVKFFLQLIDNTFADIAERSYVIGEYANADAHGAPEIKCYLNRSLS